MTLPPLPEPTGSQWLDWDDKSSTYEAFYTADQMKQYGAACAAAERERIKFELLIAHERAQGRHNYYLWAVQEIFVADAAIRAQD